MQNKLKHVTTGVISTLNQANIRTIMATGDNVLTAISVGRQCNIIDSQAEVFLGDIIKDKTSGKDMVTWKSTKSGGHRINNGTLMPEQQFFDDQNKNKMLK
jgi:cation-transporting P-type ATPase 13A2